MTREPIFNVPVGVTIVLAVLVAVHVGLSLLPEEQETWATLAMAFIPARYMPFGTELPGGSPAAVLSFVTYQLVHADIAHLLLNAAWLLAFGSAVAARVGGVRFVLFGVLCGVCGALVFLVLRWGEPVPVIGASGAVSGLMAGAFRFLFATLENGGFHSSPEETPHVPLMSIPAMLTDRRILTVIALWVGINFLMAAIAPSLISAGGIAWEVHLGGFVAGLLTFGAFEPRRLRVQP